MAGHSKWANIRHRKGLQDAKKGKIFSRLIKEITIAVKIGGEDVNSNPRLRLAIENARAKNMPMDNVNRALKKALGESDVQLQEVTFEGYGQGGAAIFIECATDNNTRTVGNVRSYFNKYNGSLGKDGCLQFIFEQKGIFNIKCPSKKDHQDFAIELIDAGAEDVDNNLDEFYVLTEMKSFGNFYKYITSLNIEIVEAGLIRMPMTFKSLEQKDEIGFYKLINALEDDEDVQKVYHNVQ